MHDDDALVPPLVRESGAGEYDSLPNEMITARRWLVWRMEKNPDPTKKPRKVPYYANGGRRTGELDSPTDRARLASFDDALRALQTGSFTGLGFALGPDGTSSVWQGVDLDDISTHPGLEFLADDLPGYTEDSPSGSGKHAIGYGRPFASLGNNGTGIEAYARGRFFTVTASGAGIHPLECLADFVEQRLKPVHDRKPQTVALEFPVAAEQSLSPQTIKDLRSALLYLRADDRKLWVDMGMSLKRHGEQGRGLWMEWSATSASFRPLEDAETWDSFKPTKLDYRHVFSTAQRVGWTNPAARDLSSFRETAEGWARDVKIGATEIAADPVASLAENIVSLDSVSGQVNCFLPHYVDMWIPQDEVTLLAGHGGGGKSYIALSVAVHVALGRPFGTLETRQANVLFFSGEDGAAVLRQRLGRICRAMSIDPLGLDGRLHLLDASDIDPALHREQKVTVGARQKIVTETPLLDALAALADKLQVGLVVVDNASDAYDDDEIKRARVRSFIRSLRSRIARPGRAVLLLAHINKASANGGRAAGSEDYSGSTAWHNSVRSRLSLIPDGDNALRIEHLKANLGAKAAPVRLEWHDGAPLVAGSYSDAAAKSAADISKAAERERDSGDKTTLISVVQDFDMRGELITTSVHGAFTVFKLLKPHPMFPKGMSSDRLTRLLRELEVEKRLFRRTVRTPSRKWREVFTCSTTAENSAPNTEVTHAPAVVEQPEVHQ